MSLRGFRRRAADRSGCAERWCWSVAPARKMLLVNSWNRWSLKRQYGDLANRPAVSIWRAYTAGKNRRSKAAMLVTPPVTPIS